jgi:CRP/FNR family cyclic AMP-dependent transcriptional regulator
MELVSRMLDGSIPYDAGRLAPSPDRQLPHNQRIAYLEEVPLFEGCSNRQLKRISRISDVIEVPPGTVIIRKGTPGDRFFVIVDGRARVRVTRRPERRLEPGECFGEMSVLDGGVRSATVAAETALRLIVIDGRDFHTLLREAPDLTRVLLVNLTRRLRQAEAALTD